MILQNTIFNFLGDSITQGVGVSDVNNIFPNILKRNFNLSQARNYGISGTRIARQHGLDPVAPAYVDRFVNMDDVADFVVVFGGTNDYGHGNAPFGDFSDRSESTFCGACHLLMYGLLQKYPDSTIIFLSPLHRLNDSNPGLHNAKPLSSYVDIIRLTAQYYALPFLDLFSMSGIQPNVPAIRQKYCPDGLHPNDAGHNIIASRLAGFIGTL